jgi:hypothetical protein
LDAPLRCAALRRGLDREEQERWCRAVLLGGLPFMWRKAEAARNVIYDRLELRPGDKVLIIGECIAPCGFVDDMKQRIGPSGDVHVVHITDEGRDNYIAKKRGRGGQLATWQWTYTRDFADGTFDGAVCPQGVQHTDDWRETGVVMEPAGTFSSNWFAVSVPRELECCHPRRAQ